MKVKVILKEYGGTENFKCFFVDVIDIMTFEESVEIIFYNNEYELKYDIKTSVNIPKKNIKEMNIHDF